jgi:hypothetical protein
MLMCIWIDNISANKGQTFLDEGLRPPQTGALKMTHSAKKQIGYDECDHVRLVKETKCLLLT